MGKKGREGNKEKKESEKEADREVREGETHRE